MTNSSAEWSYADRRMLRHEIGSAVLEQQNAWREKGEPLEVVIPEIIAALLSLAAYVAKENALLKRDDFMEACAAAALENWHRG